MDLPAFQPSSLSALLNSLLLAFAVPESLRCGKPHSRSVGGFRGAHSSVRARAHRAFSSGRCRCSNPPDAIGRDWWTDRTGGRHRGGMTCTADCWPPPHLQHFPTECDRAGSRDVGSQRRPWSLRAVLCSIQAHDPAPARLERHSTVLHCRNRRLLLLPEVPEHRVPRPDGSVVVYPAHSRGELSRHRRGIRRRLRARSQPLCVIPAGGERIHSRRF